MAESDTARDPPLKAFSRDELPELGHTWAGRLREICSLAYAYNANNWEYFETKLEKMRKDSRWYILDLGHRKNATITYLGEIIIEEINEFLRDHGQPDWRNIEADMDPAREFLQRAMCVWITQWSKECPGYQNRKSNINEWWENLWRIRETLINISQRDLELQFGIDWYKLWVL